MTHPMKSILSAAGGDSRRAFLSKLAQVCLGVGIAPSLARAASTLAGSGEGEIRLGPATARNVIYLFMRGGMSHLDTFDPKPGAATQGPVKAIATSADGVQISEYFPNLARQMHEVTVINSLSSTQGAHAQGQYLLRTSYAMRGTIQHPSLGAWTTSMAGKLNATLPGHVIVGGGSDMPGAGFLPPQFMPLPIGDPDAGLQYSERSKGISEQAFAKRLELLGKMDAAFAARFAQRKVESYKNVYDDAVRLMRSSDLVAFDVTSEPQAIRDAYGTSNFGQGCLLARRLIEHNVRFVEVATGGWDTHNQNFDSLEDKCPELDRGLAALLADLRARGLLDETLVVLATEFGRSPDITKDQNGRNHYPKAFSALLAGGGVKGGFRYGKTDREGREVVEGAIGIPDLNATIAQALGLPLAHVVHAPSGRPFTVADKGKPVGAVFA